MNNLILNNNDREFDFITNSDPRLVIGKWFIEDYKLIFPKCSKYFPYKWAQGVMIIDKQDGFNIWGRFYWRYIDNCHNDCIQWKKENLIGNILNNGTIKISEVSKKLCGKTTGFLTLTPFRLGYYELHYSSIDHSVVFKTNAYKYRLLIPN